jgi:V/A-type H+-transporting ATPase subunit A
MIQVAGEEGVSLQDYVVWQKALFFDLVFLQQDAFDPVDASSTLERQRELLDLCHRVLRDSLRRVDKESVRAYFVRLSQLVRNLNYARSGSANHARYLAEVQTLLATQAATPEDAS